MFLDLLLLALLYVSLVLITNLTSKDIIKEVDEAKDDNKYFKKKYFEYLTLSLLYVIMIYIIGGKKGVFDRTSMVVWLAMNIIYIHSFIVTVITDESVKRINRHLLRFSYILNLFGIVYLSRTLDPKLFTISMITQGVCLLVLVIGFIFTDVGASDFRCLFISIPTMIFLYKTWALLTIFTMLIFVVIHFYIKKKKMGRKAEVPIGVPILLSNLLFSLLAYLF